MSTFTTLPNSLTDKLRALNIDWAVNPQNILTIIVHEHQSLRGAINLVMGGCGSDNAAVLTVGTRDARIQL